MGAAENKALVRRFYEEVWDHGNAEVARDVFADDYVRHDLRPTHALPGAAGMAKIAADFRRAFPDLRWRVDLVLGEDDYVAARWTATGTFTGRWGDVEPTGRAATFSGVNIYRFNEDGKVAEIWNHRDDLGFMEQVGVSVWAGAAPETPSDPPGRASEGAVRVRGRGRVLRRPARAAARPGSRLGTGLRDGDRASRLGALVHAATAAVSHPRVPQRGAARSESELERLALGLSKRLAANAPLCFYA